MPRATAVVHKTACLTDQHSRTAHAMLVTRHLEARARRPTTVHPTTAAATTTVLCQGQARIHVHAMLVTQHLEARARRLITVRRTTVVVLRIV